MFGLSTLALQGIAAAAVLATAAGAAAWWHHDGVVEGRAEVQARWDHANDLEDQARKAAADQQRETDKMRRQAANTAAAGHQADKTALQATFAPINQEIERVANKSEIRDLMCLDDDGVRAINAAVATTGRPGGDAGSASGARGPMPGASAPR